jgi:hypothetical protein
MYPPASAFFHTILLRKSLLEMTPGDLFLLNTSWLWALGLSSIRVSMSSGAVLARLSAVHM